MSKFFILQYRGVIFGSIRVRGLIEYHQRGTCAKGHARRFPPSMIRGLRLTGEGFSVRPLVPLVTLPVEGDPPRHLVLVPEPRTVGAPELAVRLHENTVGCD